MTRTAWAIVFRHPTEKYSYVDLTTIRGTRREAWAAWEASNAADSTRWAAICRSNRRKGIERAERITISTSETP